MSLPLDTAAGGVGRRPWVGGGDISTGQTLSPLFAVHYNAPLSLSLSFPLSTLRLSACHHSAVQPTCRMWCLVCVWAGRMTARLTRMYIFAGNAILCLV